MKTFKVGLDIGSTTAKIAVIDSNDKLVFSRYERHHANVIAATSLLFEKTATITGDCQIILTITGSAGMGIAERFSIPFEQEVIATANLIKKIYPATSTAIDIGGEDAKIIYFSPDGTTNMRMNGNCAGGTGAFIDQMSILLGCSIEEMDALALQATHHYPIASRCGVFSKTDVQNLISKNVSKADIAASIFHAVAVQTIATLSHGCDINPKILFCGGPLTFITSLRNAFIDYLHLGINDYIVPDHSDIIPAWGAALCSQTQTIGTLFNYLALLKNIQIKGDLVQTHRLTPIFKEEEELNNWKKEKQRAQIKKVPLSEHKGYAYMGIDSGSTTTKIAVIDEQERLLFSYYAPNEGNPILAVKHGLSDLKEKCKAAGINLLIKGSCSTGYGKDLIKAAFNLDGEIIETIAHYISAKQISPDVSFILDIGGQDMKAMFIENGTLYRMEINEACSSGCGSFIDTFAQSLNYSVSKFAEVACLAKFPCDLGTRCTVFMNSKIKQFLREGATVADIAAGLSYSVAKNCLYKVLKLKNTSELGKHIVVQGGTMRNDSVVRALELLVGQPLSRSNFPELMGAYGCALYAKSTFDIPTTSLNTILQTAEYALQQVMCHGCENLCLINKYKFNNSNVYYSGNKCEKVFSNSETHKKQYRNIYTEKYEKLFNRNIIQNGKFKIGIPRVLNFYENYPFWNALFNECGIQICLSDTSTFKEYEGGIHSVMSDNICFPAKLVHSHIYNLIDKNVDRIFFPYVVYEKQENKKAEDSYNCPIVSGYSDVVKSAINPQDEYHIPVDSPVITFNNKSLLKKTCTKYLKTLGINSRIINKAIEQAIKAQSEYEEEIQRLNQQIFVDSCAKNELTVLLAGRPYHTDPLIQHKLSDMIAQLGVNVITEDIIRNNNSIEVKDTHIVSQWAYVNRILKAAKWVAMQDDHVHFVQMTSFGCGPDAFLLDEVRDILRRYNKSLTILKIDDVSNIGSMKLRVSSLIASLKFNQFQSKEIKPFITTNKYLPEDKKRKIIAPFFTEYISPLMPALFKLAGYEIEILPKSDLTSVDCGLKYANNEVCYPATLIVGDIIKALQSGKYDLNNTAVAITQTGGQCRASNYIALIKNAMVESGYAQVPVISLTFGGKSVDEQSGFKIDWFKILPITFAAVIYGDCISKFYYASAIREKKEGEAQRLKEYYLEAANKFILQNNISGLLDLLSSSTKDFNSIITENNNFNKVGIVGEIFLKFHSFAHKDVVNWLIQHKIEVVPPILSNFFLQSFVNKKVRKEEHLEKSYIPTFIINTLYQIVSKQISKINAIASKFQYFTPFNDIFEEAEYGKEIVSLSAQFGEGWLLPAEIVSYAKQNVNNVLSLQPFGCIANHIVSKGIEKRIKTLYPQMNLLSLDFDSGVSDVNIINRLHLMINNLK